MMGRQVLWSTLANYAGKFFSLGIWFFLTPFILSRLGATQYGLWVLAGSVVAYGSLLDFGMAGALTKYVAEHAARRDWDRAGRLIATALRLYTGLGLVAFAVVAALAPFFPVLFGVPPEQRAAASMVVLVMGAALGISLPGATATAVLQGLQRYDAANLVAAGSALATAVGTVLVLLAGGGVVEMVAVAIPVTVGAQVAGVLLIRRLAPDLPFGWPGAQRSLVREIVSHSASVFALAVSGQLSTKSDEIVIGAFRGVGAVTPYAVARKLSELAHVLTHQFIKVLLPLASRLHAEEDRERLRALYCTGTRLSLAIFVPIGCALALLAGPLLDAWVGPPYGEQAHLVAILVGAALLDTSQWPASMILQGMGRHAPLARVSIAAGVANLALSALLVQWLGITGVAVATLGVNLLETCAFVLPYSTRQIGVTGGELLREVLLPVFVPAALMALVLYGLREAIQPSSLFAVALVAGTSVLAYALAYAGFGAREAERELGRSLVARQLRAARSGG